MSANTYIAVIRGLGGNGSTFLSRALAALPGTLVLNECNPRSANLFEYRLNPLRQLADAEPELSRALAAHDFDLGELGAPAQFGAMVDALLAALPAERRLILRDYNFVDFISSSLNWEPTPKSSLDAALGNRARAQIVMLRDPIDQFLSLRSHRVLKRTLTFAEFLTGVLHMLDAFPDAPVVRYEQLYDAWDAEFARVCEVLGVAVGSVDLAGSSAPMSGNPRGLTTQAPERAARREKAYARFARLPATRALLGEVKERTGYA